MKIQIVSDLHLEFFNSTKAKSAIIELLAEVESDVLVLAGDIAQRQEDFDMIADVFENTEKQVLFVYGNHEFYNKSIHYRICSPETGNFHILQHDGVYVYNDVYFWGDTLWTDLPEGYNPALFVNDLSYINNLNCGLWQTLHKTHLKSLVDNITHVDVVVTHHGPSFKSVPSRFQYKPANHCFVNDLDLLIKHSNIKLWVHGHTHNSFDYMLGQTRVVCNPYGYFNNNKNFLYDKVVEI